MSRDSTFEKILVPTDGSKFARKALFQAVKIAKNLGSKIHVIIVVDPEEFPPGMLLGLLKKDKTLEESIAKFMAAVKTQARREVLAEVAICKSKGVDASYDILSGKPVEMILKYAKGKKVGLIVIGSQGLRGLGRLKVLGSTSRKVSELAPCAVMIVH
ncbi:MAG TPA: universal stress protein [Candidatus Nitrosotalea sp.]|nr:universal stress protein [Candidatus Nitrosotalea sp.]